jgi:hypothetical protein
MPPSWKNDVRCSKGRCLPGSQFYPFSGFEITCLRKSSATSSSVFLRLINAEPAWILEIRITAEKETNTDPSEAVLASVRGLIFTQWWNGTNWTTYPLPARAGIWKTPPPWSTRLQSHPALV